MSPRVALATALLCATALLGHADDADAPPNLPEVRRLHDAGQVREAVDLAEKLIELQPANLDAHRLYQDLQVEIGKGSIALRAYQKAALSKDASADALYLYGRMLEGKKAIAQYERALAADPKHVRSLCALGTALLEAGDEEEAAAVLQRATDAAPTSAMAANLRGHAAERLEQFDVAEEYFRRALALDPTFSVAHVNLALVLFAQDKRDEALAELEAAVEAAPDDPLPHIALGRLYVLINDYPIWEEETEEPAPADPEAAPAPDPGGEKAEPKEDGAAPEPGADPAPGGDDPGGSAPEGEPGEPEERPPLVIALEHFRTAVELDPDSVDARDLVAHCTLRVDPYMPMEGHLSRALALDPTSAITHVLLTASYLLRQDLEGAERSATLSMKSGEFAELYYLRGFARERNSRASKAEGDYKKAIKLDPTDPLLLRALGLMHCRQKRWKQAIAVYELLVKMEDANDRSLYDLAAVQRSAGKSKEAAETLERLVAAYPDHMNGWFDLARICHTELRRRKTRAAEAYRKYLALGGWNPRVPDWLAEVSK